jgi:hypothetical protein
LFHDAARLLRNAAHLLYGGIWLAEAENGRKVAVYYRRYDQT